MFVIRNFDLAKFVSPNTKFEIKIGTPMLHNSMLKFVDNSNNRNLMMCEIWWAVDQSHLHAVAVFTGCIVQMKLLHVLYSRHANTRGRGSTDCNALCSRWQDNDCHILLTVCTVLLYWSLYNELQRSGLQTLGSTKFSPWHFYLSPAVSLFERINRQLIPWEGRNGRWEASFVAAQ